MKKNHAIKICKKSLFLGIAVGIGALFLLKQIKPDWVAGLGFAVPAGGSMGSVSTAAFKPAGGSMGSITSSMIPASMCTPWQPIRNVCVY